MNGPEEILSYASHSCSALTSIMSMTHRVRGDSADLGLGTQAPTKLCSSTSLPTDTLSFQSDFSLGDKTTLVKSVSDTDAKFLAVLPKVSELKKYFEGADTNDSEMNRKERIARRLEGIESDAPPALVPGGLVANRMLEEDPPRYTRASDPCEPCVMVRRYSREELEAPQKQVSSPDKPQVKSGVGGGRQEPVLVYVDPVSISSSSAPTTGPADSSSLSSKAERIARYKAERRRQLSERYGILLDQEPDIDYTPRYRSRRDPEVTDRQPAPRRDRDRQEVEEQGREPKVPYRSGVGRVYMRTHPEPSTVSTSTPAHSNQAPPPTQERQRGFSERERAMNIENHRCGGPNERSITSRSRTQELHLPPPQQQQQQHHHQDDTHQESSPASTRDYSIAAVPSSPRTARRASLPSTRYGISPGDLFIEQQAQSILNRQGEPTKVDLTTMEVDPASGSDRDRGTRRPRRYITPGDNRMSERFRTQPITSAERLESDRSRLSPSQLQDVEEKLDERAKMSVAAKRSLFRELERTSEGCIPKPRSRNAAVERRLRRVQDRSHTQPVTNKEVVNASSDPATSSQPVGIHTNVTRVPSPTILSTSVTNISIQPSSQPGSAGQDQEKETQERQKPTQAPSAGAEGDSHGPVSDEPDLSTLSLTEKMALFNRLSHTTGKSPEAARGDTRLRRANARFQTQPITQGEVEQTCLIILHR